MAAMNTDMGGLGGRPTNPQANPFGTALHGAGPGLIRTGLEAYGGRFLYSSSEFMQSNVNLYTGFMFRDQCIYLGARKAKPHSFLSDNTIFVRPSVLLSSQQPVCEEQTEGYLVPFLAQGKGLATFNLSLQDFSYCDLVKSHNICLTFIVFLKGSLDMNN